MLKRIEYLLVVVLLAPGCRKEVQKPLDESKEKEITGSYSLIEHYEAAEGPQAGAQGSSEYSLQVRADSVHQFILFENIAQAYTIRGTRSGDSVFLVTTKFPYHAGSVTISGHGKFNGDSLFLELSSGGPAGQIKSICRGMKRYSK